MSQKPSEMELPSNQATASANPGAEYALTARFYDQVYATAAPTDIEFYLELSRHGGGPVLELGCGTGRVALPLARAGHQVCGVDRSAAMLAQFRDKLARESAAVQQRVTLVAGSLEELELPHRFSLVTMPFRVFQSLLSVEQQLRALAVVARHLAPEGRYVFDAFNPNLAYIVDAMRRGPVPMQDQQWSDAQTGHHYRRLMALRYDPSAQLIDIDWRFEEYDGAGLLQNTWREPMRLRWLYRFEAEHLLARAGFAIEAAYGDYARQPLDENSRELIYVCKLAQAN